MYNRGAIKVFGKEGMCMKKARFILKLLGCVLCGAGCIWFLLPAFRGGFRLGAVFGLCVCLLGLTLLLCYRSLVEAGHWRRICARILAAAYVVGLCWAAALTGLMFSVQMRTPPAGANVIVLGAQIYSAERMGVSLTNRVDTAAAYLLEYPEARCIVTGGQGGDEPCPESLTQKNGLVRRGIEAGRIYMEDKSHNTRENMVYAMEIAEEEGLGTEVAVVTQSFHMFRALQLAESAGFTAYSLVADTDPLLFPEYYGRELLSLTKWIVQYVFLDLGIFG